MKKSALFMTGAVVLPALLLVVNAANPSSDPFGLWKAFPAIYKIHSGIVADRTPPTAEDRILTVMIDGEAAKKIFDSLGPDSPDKCSGADGDRERGNKGVNCTYTAHLSNPKNSHYRCWVGMNLRTGDGDVRVSC